MGLDIFFVTKNKDDNQIYKSLSRYFCYLVSGHDAYGDDCELYQLEKILNLDLSIFTKTAHLEPPTDELEYELYLAKEDNDTVRINSLEEQINKFIEDWEQNYLFDTNGWTNVKELEKAVLSFYDAITLTPDYHKELRYNLNWDSYFTPDSPTCSWQKKLYLDLELLKSYTLEANKINEQFSTFNFG